GGQPVGYQGSVVTQGIGRNVDWKHGSQTESLAGAHIVDGPDKQVEVKVKIPEGGKLPVAEFDLEARVVVYIVRGGVSQPGFDVRIGSRDGTVVRAKTTPKGANLWCPPGNAEIKV